MKGNRKHKQLKCVKPFSCLARSLEEFTLGIFDMWLLLSRRFQSCVLFFLVPLPNLEQDEAYIRAEAHNHANNLNRYMTLRYDLSPLHLRVT